MRKVVVYAGTRNVYLKMAAAAKSLIRYNHIDCIYFLIEDDTFIEPLPNVVKCINVKDQTYFPPNGANYNNPWSYMTLIRLALPAILPDEKRVLWLDVDTIVADDISELFETDLQGCYFAAAEEPSRSKQPFIYHNAGVLLMDLEALRRDGKHKELIRLVNNHKMDFPDQDCINLSCQQQIKLISPVYNACKWTAEPADARIFHFCGSARSNRNKTYFDG